MKGRTSLKRTLSLVGTGLLLMAAAAPTARAGNACAAPMLSGVTARGPVSTSTLQDIPPQSELRPVRLSSPPSIDGVLEEGAWQAALVSGFFRTYHPNYGEDLPQQTEVWLGYDDEALYFAFRCRDTEPDRIKTTVTQRDNMFSDDWVGLTLDAQGNGQTAYEFFVNPSGIQGDILFSAGRGEDQAPDFVWESAARITPQGWEAEVRVPLRSIRFRSGSEVVMRVLFWRHISRLGSAGSWPEMLPGQGVAGAQTRLVFHDLRAPMLLDLLPSFTWGGTRSREEARSWSDGGSQSDLGAGLKYGLGSGATVEATWNPDFSQVESDAFQAEVNRRFPVFYQEKRPFFMEGLDIFDFAVMGHGMILAPIHTRRIVDPIWGSKLTGTAGRSAFGVLAASDEFPGYAWSDTTNPDEGKRAGFLVGRAKYSLEGDSYLGVLAADHTFAGSGNRVAGADAALRFGEGHRTTFSLLHSRTSQADLPDRVGTGINATWDYGSRPFNAAAAFEHYDPGFRMDTAFQYRTGVDNGWIWLSPNFYPDPERFYWLRRISPEFVVSRTFDKVTRLGDDFVNLILGVFFSRQGQLRLENNWTGEGWQGEVHAQRMTSLNGQVQLLRWLRFGGLLGLGRTLYYQGDPPYVGRARIGMLWFMLQPGERFSQYVELFHEDFHHPDDGHRVYTVDILNTRTTYQFNRWFFLRGILQYNGYDERLLTDFLASFTWIPGTVVHLGYGSLYDRRTWREDTWVMGEGSLTEVRRGIFFKVSYLWRF
jgi:hypothetical protein